MRSDGARQSCLEDSMIIEDRIAPCIEDDAGGGTAAAAARGAEALALPAGGREGASGFLGRRRTSAMALPAP